MNRVYRTDDCALDLIQVALIEAPFKRTYAAPTGEKYVIRLTFRSSGVHSLDFDTKEEADLEYAMIVAQWTTVLANF